MQFTDTYLFIVYFYNASIDSANYTGPFYIGDRQMECEQWVEDIRTDEAEGFSSVAYTRGNCVPFSSVFSGVIREFNQGPRKYTWINFISFVNSLVKS